MSDSSQPVPVISVIPSNRARTLAMNSSGNSCSSIAVIARARRTIAFSSLGTAPCPARPVARSRPQASPFSAVCTR